MISHLINSKAILQHVAALPPDYTIGNAGKNDPSDVIFEGWDLGHCQHAGAYIHRFLKADKPDCFHSHNGAAFRYCVQGGYVEEEPDGTLTVFREGDFGLITHDFVHRVAYMLDGPPPVTVWIHGPRIYPVRLIGKGWGDREGVVE